MEKKISKSSIQRFPIYVEYLRSLLSNSEAPLTIPSANIAAALHLGEVQVRKDLGSVSSLGKPKVGYVVADLLKDIEHFMGYSNVNDAALIGAGKLGKALLNYGGFSQYGLNIISAFDIDETKIGKTPEGKIIMPLSKFSDFVQMIDIKIGIITVPAKNAQSVCDLMIKSGILAIWNFSSASLKGKENILIRNENMAVSLAVLSNHLKQNLSIKK
jgi:redox-sensing transcriptional repressor